MQKFMCGNSCAGSGRQLCPILFSSFYLAASTSLLLSRSFYLALSASLLLPRSFYFAPSASLLLPRSFHFGRSALKRSFQSFEIR